MDSVFKIFNDTVGFFLYGCCHNLQFNMVYFCSFHVLYRVYVVLFFADTI